MFTNRLEPWTLIEQARWVEWVERSQVGRVGGDYVRHCFSTEGHRVTSAFVQYAF